MSNVIDTYTIQEATDDGVLFDVRPLLPLGLQNKSLISHITNSLLYSEGYYKETENGDYLPFKPNIMDLCSQAFQIVMKGLKEDTELYHGDIEAPSGSQLRIWIVYNQIDRFTVMLPEDY